MDTHTRRQLIKLRQEFMQRQQSANKKATRKKTLIRPFGEIEAREGESSMERYEAATHRLQAQMGQTKPWYLLDPEGVFCRIWHSLAVMLIFMLLLYLPIVSAFLNEGAQCDYLTITGGDHTGLNYEPGHPFDRGWRVFPVVTNAFFLADILVNLVTGIIHDDGVRNYSVVAIWQHYFKIWFWVDAISCIPLECILLAAAPHSYFYNIPKFIRLIRLSGIRRRAQGSPFRWVDKISELRHEFSYGAQRLVVAALAAFTAVHWYACILWWTLRLEGFPEGTWPIQLGLDPQTSSVPELYLWSLFCIWSLMISYGFGPYAPITWPEAFVQIFASATCSVLYCTLNGFILALILSTSSSRHRFKEKMDMITEAVDSRDLPGNLRSRILRFFKYKYREGRVRNQEEILAELPYEMKVSVALHSVGGHLEALGILAEEPTLLQRVALQLRPAYALRGEEIVRQGWPGRIMYFIKNGYVDLIMDGVVVDTLHDGNHFGEAALLSLPPSDELLRVCGDQAKNISSFKELFPSIFTARALTNCDMFSLDAQKFHEMVEEYPGVEAKLHAWALRHAQRMIKYGIDLGPQPQHINMPPEDSLPSHHGHSLARSLTSPAVFLDILKLRKHQSEDAEDSLPNSAGSKREGGADGSVRGGAKRGLRTALKRNGGEVPVQQVAELHQAGAPQEQDRRRSAEIAVQQAAAAQAAGAAEGEDDMPIPLDVTLRGIDEAPGRRPRVSLQELFAPLEGEAPAVAGPSPASAAAGQHLQRHTEPAGGAAAIERAALGPGVAQAQRQLPSVQEEDGSQAPGDDDELLHRRQRPGIEPSQHSAGHHSQGQAGSQGPGGDHTPLLQSPPGSTGTDDPRQERQHVSFSGQADSHDHDPADST